jgi:hypothetical protein
MARRIDRNPFLARRQLVKIKSQKDFFSGLLFMGFGIAFGWGALGYKLGVAGRMGPGYFPLILGSLMTLLGGVITLKALVPGKPGYKTSNLLRPKMRRQG